MSRPALGNLLWLVSYLLIVALIVVKLVDLRGSLLVELGTADAQANWQQWLDDESARSEQTGPVQRRTPKSAEPPSLVLLRDHFTACLTGAILFASMLFAFLMIAIKGVLRQTPAEDRPRESAS